MSDNGKKSTVCFEGKKEVPFMDAIEAILGRRSIRIYADAEVQEDTVEELLKAAMAAPSAGNQQPWHFVVVDDRELLRKVTDVHPYAQMAAKAPLGILVCGDPSLEKHEGYWVQDCAAATENLLLAAYALGLGAVWTGVHPRVERAEGFRKLFGIPRDIIPFAFVVIGYPAENKLPSERYAPDRVSRNGWKK